MTPRFTTPSHTQLLAAIAAMGVVVLSSNILVQYAINDWLTWGAITYPFAFLVSVAWVGFAVAVAASLVLAPPRIALASGAAFIASQWLDIAVFHRLRAGRWWRAPLVATLLAACLDTFLFWSIAFAGAAEPWVTWALGDLGVKLVLGVALLLPFRLAIARWWRATAAH
jgi:uncharacterized PurR-regulated membrane protein YhhQ (DUF165 family)